MNRITEKLPTKAAKIRALGAEGFSRTEIATFLGVRYQHVRNVLVQAAPPVPAAAPGEGTMSQDPPQFGRTHVDADGRVGLPSEVLSDLGILVGGVVPWRVEGDELILMSPAAGMRRAREIVAEHASRDGSSWVDELIADRRAEAKKELDEGQHG